MPAPHYKQPPTDARAVRSGYARAFAGKPTSVDEASRSFDVIVTTEAPVRRCIPDPRLPDPVPDSMDCSYIEVDEVLVAAGVDFGRARGMPLIDCHDTYSGIAKILGKVDELRIEGDAIVGRASLARLHAELLPDIVDGFFGNISAGYDYDLKRDAVLIERPGEVPLLQVNRWLLTEASIVPVGADPYAFIRSAFAPPPPMQQRSATPKQERFMDIEELVSAAEAAVAAADEAISAAEDAVPTELVDRIKSLRGIRADDDAEHTGEADPEKKPGEEDAGARAEDASDEADKQEYENLRSVARGYGLGKYVDDLRALGTPAADAKRSLSKEVQKRGATGTSSADKPVVVKPAQRAADTSINTNDIYGARAKNKR
ncbi:hypothetical protein [Rhizobium sp. 1399]|uniref:hypothetical protein n=1 Tax=Rhizobium sp. 1399 TaxID=2817758 RepID=UPI00285D2A0A|nr:hypothetical protein [Rhizobium sp. 1399]MDR6664022.1 hypothetical protein [Rhizobium sp. 1399]